MNTKCCLSFKYNKSRTYLVLINASWICFGFVLDFSNIALLDFSDTDLDLLNRSRLHPSKHFSDLLDICKKTSRNILKTSSRHVLE